MAGNVLPPVKVTFTASVAAALKSLTQLADTLTRVGEAAKEAAAAFDESMTTLGAAAARMAEGVDASSQAAAESMAALDEKSSAIGASFAAGSDEAVAALARLTEAARTAAASMEEVAVTSKTSAEEGTASTDLLGSKWLGLGSITEKVAKWGSLGLIGIGVEAGRMASKFQTAMTQINTQAGVSKSQVASLGNGVLDLAGKVGFAPDNLAEALFHVESSFASTGITGQKAMQILQTAAEGAKIGGADLVDVQNALDAAVASGISGVQNYGQAMGALNAIVGSGDMQMQDLANALGTGVLAVVKGYGITLADTGAALATFGDNNIRGAVAATDFRMAVQALAVPAATASADLKKLGMTNQTLADDMQKGGLKLALNDLIDRFRKAGITAADQGQVITDMFGKKAGAGLAVLLGQLDRLNSKYPEEAKGANGFAAAWVTAKQTLAVQFDQIKAGFDSLMIRIGDRVLPATSKLITLLESKGAPVVKNFSQALAGITSGFTGNMGAAATPQLTGRAGRMAEMDGPSQSAPLTQWQKLGETLRGISDDFKRFGEDCVKAFDNVKKAAGPVLQVLGTAFVGALKIVGEILANVVGPALKDFSGFLASNKGLIKDFTEVALAGLALKLGVIGSIKAATGITSLAAKILGFPVNQVGAIGKAFKDLKKSAKDVATAAGKIKSAFMKVPWGSMAKGIGSGFSKVWSGIGNGAVKAAGVAGRAWRGTQDLLVAGAGKAGTAWRAIQSGASTAASAVADFGAKAGSAIASAASSAWSGIVSGLQAVGGAAKSAALGLVDLGQKALASAVAAARSAAAWVAEKVALVASAVAEKAAAAAEWLLNVALDANPIMLVVLAIAALVAALIYAYEHSKTFRDIVQAAFKVVGDMAMWLWHNVFEPAFKGIVDVISVCVDWVKSHWPLLLGILTGPIGMAVYLLTHYWKQISQAFSDAWSAVKSAAVAAVHWVSGLPGMILHALGDLGSLLFNAGANIIHGLINGIQSMLGSVGSVMHDVTSFITGFLPHSPAKWGPLRGNGSPEHGGRSFARMMAQGILDGQGDVAAAMSKLTGTASLTIHGGTASALAVGGSGAAAAAASQPIIVQVDGKTLFKIMQTQALRNGRRNPTTGLVYAGT